MAEINNFSRPIRSDHLEEQEHNCKDGWVCEQHPDKPFPHENEVDPQTAYCPGPGMLCPKCKEAFFLE